MKFLKNLLGGKEEKINSNADFWKWFAKNEQRFFKVVKNHNNIEADFFDHLSPKLAELKEGYFFLTGMMDENTAELILTADGDVKNIGFVEELVAAAPPLKTWKFTALKPATSIENLAISMAGFEFDNKKLSFYSNEYPDRPDIIDITLLHEDYLEDEKQTIVNGSYIFLDNLLGELNFASIIDDIEVMNTRDAKKEIVPIEKLNDFLIWRQKEFIEKYEGTINEIDNDEGAIMKAAYPNGDPIIAKINTYLLTWEGKASHPWVLNVTIKYKDKDQNGLPNDTTMEVLNKIETELLDKLIDIDGYLYIGRQSGGNIQNLFFACKDFRKPSKTIFELIKQHSDQFEIDYDIYKDKYWNSFDQYVRH